MSMFEMISWFIGSLTVCVTQVDNKNPQSYFELWNIDISSPTLVLLAGEGALTASKDPEDKVGHAEGEGDDGVAKEEGQEQHQ